MDSCSVYSCTPSRWLDSRRLPHLKLEQVFCNKIFVGGTRYGQTMSIMRCKTESFATHGENKDDLRLPQRVSHFIDILVDFVSPKNIDIDTPDCCALLPEVDGYIPPAVLHTTYIQREPGKKRWHPLTSLRTCLGKLFCR